MLLDVVQGLMAKPSGPAHREPIPVFWSNAIYWPICGGAGWVTTQVYPDRDLPETSPTPPRPWLGNQ